MIFIEIIDLLTYKLLFQQEQIWKNHAKAELKCTGTNLYYKMWYRFTLSFPGTL